MPSQSKMTRNVESIISSKARVGGRDPIAALIGMAEARTSREKAQVDEAIVALESDGKIDVERQNGRVTEITHKPPRRRHVDRTERSPQEKRERTFAKDVPAYLPDDKCTPVQVSYVQPHVADTDTKESVVSEMPLEKVGEIKANPFVYIKGQPYHEALTTCLLVLREMADEDGCGANLSVRAVLREMVENMTDNAVTRVMDHLRGMNIYETKMVAYATSSYQLNMSITEVTAEMVTRFRQARREAAKQLNATADDTVQAVGNSGNELLQLADIIESQEVQIGQLNGALVALDDKLAEVNVQRDRLMEENSQLNELVATLQEQLSRRSQPDPRVADILARYKLGSS